MTEADPRRLLVKVAKILKRLNVPYLVTGGIAVLVWGRPRFTADIDIVVELRGKDTARFAGEFKKLGSGYFDEEMMVNAVKKREEFNFIDGETGVKVDFWLLQENDDFDISRLKRRVAKKILGEIVYFTSPEDLILIKLKWYKNSGSSRQLEDVESIIKISGNELKRAYLEKWAKRLSCWELLEKLL
ncbi:MAG: nucleotidyltransferase [Candidatus Liptonbacteria bacterium]|nr:nucleotidyltransferase [Candidatus Liptonbacteria bacterium]